MAERFGVLHRFNDGKFLASWEGLLERGGTLDTGSAVSLPPALGSVLAAAIGNFDTSATIRIEGSNDGVNWFLLATALTAADPFQIIAAQPLFVRPAVGANGAGDTSDLDVTISGSYIG